MYDGILLAVGHSVYKTDGAASLRRYGKPSHIFYDVKSLFAADESDFRLYGA